MKLWNHTCAVYQEFSFLYHVKTSNITERDTYTFSQKEILIDNLIKEYKTPKNLL